MRRESQFRAVAVAACDDGVIPSQDRIDEIGDYADLDDVWETERQLLYVACTRARDHLLVIGVTPGGYSSWRISRRAMMPHQEFHVVLQRTTLPSR